MLLQLAKLFSLGLVAASVALPSSTLTNNITNTYPEQVKTGKVEVKSKVTVYYFKTSWCPICTQMTQTVLPYVDKTNLVIVDVTKNTAAQRAMMQKYGVYGFPAFVRVQGKSSRTVHGYQSIEQMKRLLK